MLVYSLPLTNLNSFSFIMSDFDTTKIRVFVAKEKKKDKGSSFEAVQIQTTIVPPPSSKIVGLPPKEPTKSKESETS